MNTFLVIAVILGFSVLVINGLAFLDQRKNPGPRLNPSEVAKLTAMLSILFAIFLAIAALTWV